MARRRTAKESAMYEIIASAKAALRLRLGEEPQDEMYSFFDHTLTIDYKHDDAWHRLRYSEDDAWVLATLKDNL